MVSLEGRSLLAYQLKMTFKEHLISFIQTFLATFCTVMGTVILSLPLDTILTPDFWKTGAIAGLVMGAVRTTIKVVWQKYMPVSVGGVRR